MSIDVYDNTRMELVKACQARCSYITVYVILTIIWNIDSVIMLVISNLYNATSHISLHRNI
jgi:hypothetical protein